MSRRGGEVLYEAPATKWPEKDEPPFLAGSFHIGAQVYAAAPDHLLDVGIWRAHALEQVITSNVGPQLVHVFNVAREAMQRLYLAEVPARASDVERRLAMLEQEVRALKVQLQPDVKRLPCAAVELSGVFDSYDVDDRAQLEQRLNARPSMHATIAGAATAIQALFKDGRPKLVFESSGRISIHIPTKFDAEQASVLYDRLLKEWWRGNVSVEDKMSLALDFI